MKFISGGGGGWRNVRFSNSNALCVCLFNSLGKQKLKFVLEPC